MMLDHMGETEAARPVEGAIFRVVAEGGVLTPDLGGTASTEDLGKAIAAAI